MKYIRTAIITFDELPSRVQKEFTEYGEMDQFVQDPCDENDYIPLELFFKCRSKRWDGFYGTSYFSGYFIKLGIGEATVAYRHW